MKKSTTDLITVVCSENIFMAKLLFVLTGIINFNQV